ncbi:MAG TPA: hypothetical protein VMP10_04640 [Chloroflexota bacterium]|nr:hypothetical protein [Chloroflexota bacterium]
MMSIIAHTARLLALPGIVVHELAHYYFCLLAGARVHEVVFFRFGHPAGYVVHSAPRRFTAHLLISVGPLLVNSLLALLLFTLARVTYLDVATSTLLEHHWSELAHLAVVAWLGLSVALQALPSSGDATSLWQVTSWHLGRRHFLALAGVPVVGLIRLTNVLRAVFVDWIYAAVLAGLPWWLGSR